MADVLLTVGLDSSAYSEFKKGIDDIIKKINSDPPKIKVEFDNKELDKMRKQIEALTKAQREMASAAKESSNIEVGSTQYFNKLRQANNLLTQLKLNTQKWTAAQNGEKHDQFGDYSANASALENLISRLEKGSITAKQFDQEFAAIRANMAVTSGEIKVAGEATGEMTRSLSNAATNIVKFIGAYRLISTGIRVFKEMANVSIEIESAMAQIQVVTGATGSELEGFFQTSTSLAKELGQSITDVAKSIETFSRLGFKLEDASSLAEYATILSNVADTDINAATTGLTSIIKGYDMDVSNAEHVADVLTKVGQAYAISAEELMTAFERGGASMYAQGTSFEKSAALFAATNASLQNAQKTGTIWNTVAARITASVSQLEEMGEETEGLADGFSKYREELLALTGVDVQKPTGEFRDLYDIFVDLANVWDNLRSDQARSRVGEILGGTRNRAGIMSTITNIKDAINAYNDAMNSSGIAMQANDIIMDTTEKHIEQLKVSFQELSANMISSDGIKGIVDLGNGFVQLLNNIQNLTAGFGGLPTAIGAVTVAIFALKGALTGSAFAGIGGIFTSAIKGITGLGVAGATLTGTLGAIAPAALAVIGAISALASVFNHAKQSQENHLKELKEADEIYTTNTDNIQSYKDRISELRTSLDEGTLSEADAYEAKKELLDIQNQLFDSYGKQVEGIDLVNGKIDEQIGKLSELTKAEANQFLNEAEKDYGSIENIEKILYDTYGGKSGTLIGFYDGLKDDAKVIKEIAKEYDNIVIDEDNGFGTFSIRYVGSAVDAYNEAEDVLTKTREAMEGLDDASSAQLKNFFDNFTTMKDGAEGVYNEYYDIYRRILDAQRFVKMMDDDTIYTRGEASNTAAGWLSDYSKRVDAYNKAIVFGNEEQIKVAKREYEAWTEIMDDLIAEHGFSNYAKDVYEIRDGLIEAAKAVQDYDDAVEKSQSFREARDKVKGLKPSQVKYNYYFGEEGALPTEEAHDLIDALIEVNRLSEGFDDTALDSALSWLVDCGVLLSDVADNAEDAGEKISEILTMGDLTDTEGDFQKNLENYKSEILSLQSDLKKALDGELTADDIFDLKLKHPELKNYSGDNIANGIKSLILGQVKGAESEINEAMSKTGSRAAQEYLISLLDSFLLVGNTDVENAVEESPLKGTIEDFYDILKNEDFNESVENVTSNIDKVKSAMDKLKDGDYTKADFYEDFVSQFPGIEQYANSSKDALDNIRKQLDDYSKGGNVDLKVRPIIDTEELNKAGWDAGDGMATLFSSTFSNKAGDVAVNFTPIMTDKNGNYTGVMSPDALQKYAEGVIDGVHADTLNLQIGAEFTGEDAIDQAVAAAEKYHGLHEEMLSKFGIGNETNLSEITASINSVDGLGAALEELFNQLMYGGPLVGDAGSLTGVFNSKLEQLSEVSPEAASALRDWLNSIQESYAEVESATSAIDNLKESLGGFATYQGNVSKALGASTSAVGLTTEEIMNLVDAYKDIESFDAAKLFQSTGDGVRLNTEELERLNAIIERNTLTDLYHNLADARQKLAEAQANGDDTTGLENDIATAQALIAQYEGMTSAYNTWLQAKAGGGERDSYEAIGRAYGEMEKIYNAGWYDDPALQSYLNLLLGDNRTGNAVEDWGRLSQTIGDTGKSLMDFWQYGENGELVTDGLFDMLDVIHDYDSSIVKAGKDGKYSFDLTADNIQKVADYLGTSPEMVRRFARAFDDIGDVTVIGNVVDDLETAQNAVDRIGQIIGEAKSKNAEIDIKTVVENSDEIQSLAEEIASLPPEVQTEIGITTVGDVDGILKQLSENPESIGITVNYEQGEAPESVDDASGKANYTVGESPKEVDDASGKANFTLGKSPLTVPAASGVANFSLGKYPTSLPSINQTVVQHVVKRETEAFGTLPRARANGSVYNVANLHKAYANGKVALGQDELALVNELGTESIIRDGNWYLLPRGMHQEALKKGDIVLSAAQTKALINTGAAPGHGHAYAYGSLGHAYAESYFGTGLQRRQNNNKTNNTSNNSSGNNNYRNTSNTNNSNRTKTSTKDKSSSDEKKDFKEVFDWIEVRIDRIERRIKNLGVIAQSTFKNLTTRLKASNNEIKSVQSEIINQSAGLTRYLKEANKVGLSKAWQKRVQAGTIDINTIKDEKLAEKIKEYQQWYYLCPLY